MSEEADAPGREVEGEIGAQLVRLLWEPAWWIKRRIEQISFDDDATVCRRTFFDIGFETYLADDPYLPRMGSRALLPISLQPRTPSREITVSTAGGEPLPHLNRNEERSLLCNGLAHLATDLAPLEASRVPPLVRAERLLELLEDGLGPDLVDQEWLTKPQSARLKRLEVALKPYADDFIQNRLVVAMPEVSALYGDPDNLRLPTRIRIQEVHSEGVEGGRGTPKIVRWIRERSVVGKFRMSPLALRPIPSWLRRTLAASHEVEVVKIARRLYEKESTAHAIYRRDRSRWVGHKVPRDHRPIWTRSPRRDDLYYRFHARELQSAESYHLELVCPPGIFIDEAWLVITRPFGEPRGREEGEIHSQDVEIIEVEDDDPHWDAAHFYYFEALPEASWRDPETDDLIKDVEAEVLAVLRPMYHGVMRAGRNTSILTCALLVVLTFSLGWMAAGFPALIRLQFLDIDTNSVVSLLLLAPTAALTVLIRQDEHLLIKRVVESYRQRLAVIAGCTFLAAVALAVGLTGVWLFWCLALCTGVSVCVTRMTIGSAAYSRDRVTSYLEVAPSQSSAGQDEAFEARP